MFGYLYTPIYFFFRDLNKISDGIGSKFGRIISSLVSFVSGYVIALIYLWQLKFVGMAVLPLVVFVGGMFAKVGYSRWAHKKWGREGKEEERKQEQGQWEGEREGEREGGREGGMEGGMEKGKKEGRNERRKEGKEEGRGKGVKGGTK